jgi:hypothetical protein
MIDNQPSGGEFIENPTWQDIETALIRWQDETVLT